MALAALLLEVSAAWRWLRPGAENDRVACWVAAVGTTAPVCVSAVLLAHAVVLLGMVLLVGSPLLGVPAIAGVLLGATVLMGRLLPRTDDPVAFDPAAAPPAAPTAGESGAGGRLRPGGQHRATVREDTARSRLYWPGYRTAADQRTPQQLTMRISAAEEPVPVAFLSTPPGDDHGPAPFDLKAEVEGGAVIEVSRREADPVSAG